MAIRLGTANQRQARRKNALTAEGKVREQKNAETPLSAANVESKVIVLTK